NSRCGAGKVGLYPSSNSQVASFRRGKARATPRRGFAVRACVGALVRIMGPKRVLQLWLPLAAAYHAQQHPSRHLHPRTGRFATRVPLHPLCGSWLYPDEEQGLVEVTTTAEAEEVYEVVEVEEK
ncbi:MAG: hypothetical protein ACKVKF_02900, partial [Rhodobacterales bacterium]